MYVQLYVLFIHENEFYLQVNVNSFLCITGGASRLALIVRHGAI